MSSYFDSVAAACRAIRLAARNAIEPDLDTRTDPEVVALRLLVGYLAAVVVTDALESGPRGTATDEEFLYLVRCAIEDAADGLVERHVNVSLPGGP